MKRLCVFLLTALLLTGCGIEQPPETTEPVVTNPTETEPQPAGVYVPDSSAEEFTDGAVRLYAPDKGTYEGLYSMGSHLLIAAEGGLLTLTGEDGVPTAVLETGADMRISCIDAAATGVGYYLPYTREVVTRNPQLRESGRWKMPENMVGEPTVSMAQNQVYYITATEVRVLDLHTGISRLIRQRSTAGQMQLESLFGGTVLKCSITDAAGESVTEYISTQTGQSLEQDRVVDQLQTLGDQFFARYMDSTEELWLFGDKDGSAQVLQIPQNQAAILSGQEAILEMNGVVSYEQTKLGLVLAFYDLEEGLRTARVMLPELQMPSMLCSDGTYIWFLAAKKDTEQYLLYRWDIAKSAVEDATDYVHPFYTAESPDKEGLAACRAQADELESTYGIKFALWEDAVKNTGKYTVTPEHNPNILSSVLRELESALQKLPKNVLKETLSGGQIRICVVRNIEGQEAVQFREEELRILLASESDVVHWFYRSIALAIDSHVLGNSRDFDTWDKLNPKGFTYAYSDDVPEQSKYLEGEERAFTDLQAMSYPHKDRCSVFAYAMLPDNGEVFVSSAIQAKLLRLCMGIREAYGLEKSTEQYPWEQYLEKSLAYVKK